MKFLIPLVLATSLGFGATPTREQSDQANALAASCVDTQKALSSQLDKLRNGNKTLTMTTDQQVGLSLYLMAVSEGDLFSSLRQNMEFQMGMNPASKADIAKVELARLMLWGRLAAQSDRYKGLLLLLAIQTKSPEIHGLIKSLSETVTASDTYLKELATGQSKPILTSPVSR
jgi:hypothetical protein